MYAWCFLILLTNHMAKRYHDFSPKDLQTEMVASSKSFNSALRGKKKRVVILIIGVPTLKLQILYKIITHCYGALRFSHPLADLHRYWAVQREANLAAAEAEKLLKEEINICKWIVHQCDDVTPSLVSISTFLASMLPCLVWYHWKPAWNCSLQKKMLCF